MNFSHLREVFAQAFSMFVIIDDLKKKYSKFWAMKAQKTKSHKCFVGND